MNEKESPTEPDTLVFRSSWRHAALAGRNDARSSAIERAANKAAEAIVFALLAIPDGNPARMTLAATLNMLRDATAIPEFDGAPMAKAGSWKDRLILEKTELDARLVKLREFLDDGRFMDLSRNDRILLLKQEDAMVAYSMVLTERIEALTKESK